MKAACLQGGKCREAMSQLIELKDVTLIDLLLEEERTIEAPVARAAQKTEQLARGGAVAQRGLIPLSAPKAGEQYAFEVNLDRCSGCKGCVTACHSMNGLDEGETWRDVGLLVGEDRQRPYQQTVTTACHHCVDPACLNGCPVNAYEKDPRSGIVLHLDDQCIGCQYCALKCPYDVPKYNPKRGIVRKCDMCHSRLSDGEAPACAQACPHEAIRIVTVDQGEAGAAREEAEFLPGAPAPNYTKPATRYRSRKGVPRAARAADAARSRPQPAHWPLVAMLSLSQLGVGGLVLAAFGWGELSLAGRSIALLLSWALLHVGLAASALHLGQPLKAWRVFLGLRRSWLSREAVVFGAVSLAATAAAGALVYEMCTQRASSEGWRQAVGLLLMAASVGGLFGVLSSAYIYIDTRRRYWRSCYSLGKFFGSASLGACGIGALATVGSGLGWTWTAAIVALGAGKLWLEWRSRAENADTLRIFRGPLAAAWRGRVAIAACAYAAAPLAFVVFENRMCGGVLLGSLALSEGWERALYFKAVNAPKMPGGFGA